MSNAANWTPKFKAAIERLWSLPSMPTRDYVAHAELIADCHNLSTDDRVKLLHAAGA